MRRGRWWWSALGRLSGTKLKREGDGSSGGRNARDWPLPGRRVHEGWGTGLVGKGDVYERRLRVGHAAVCVVSDRGLFQEGEGGADDRTRSSVYIQGMGPLSAPT